MHILTYICMTQALFVVESNVLWSEIEEVGNNRCYMSYYTSATK